MLIDWFTVAAQIVNFLILVALLRYFLYGRIVRAMHERQQRIVARLAEAEQRQQEAEQQAAAYRRQRQELEQQQAELMAQARQEADAGAMADRPAPRADGLPARPAPAHGPAGVYDGPSRPGGSGPCRVGAPDYRRLPVRALEATDWEALAAPPQDTAPHAVIRSAFDLPQGVRRRLLTILREHLGATVETRFETSPDVVCGIELQTNGQKIAWSLEHYLAALEDRLSAALDRETRQTTMAAGDGEHGEDAATPTEGEQRHGAGT